MDGRRIRNNKVAFLNLSGIVRTGPENQLFGYIRYCTEIPEIKSICCQIHAIFTISVGSFFRYNFLKMGKMCILEKLNFKFSRGSMPPDPPVYSRLRRSILFFGITLNCFRRACYYQWVLRMLRTQKDVSFLSRKGCTFSIVQIYIYIYILRTADMRSAQA